MKGDTIQSNCVKDYTVEDGDDFRVTIRAKDFPDAGAHGEFRIYTVYGDITKPRRLAAAVGNLLTANGIDKREILVTL